MIVLFQPVWLLLLIPLAALWFLRPLPNRWLRGLRAAAFLVLVLAMCYPAIRLPDRSGTVVVVADRSESMPPQTASSQKETVDLLQKSMGPRDLLAVVSFGRFARIERPPQQGEFGGFNAQVAPEHSNLHEALETALALIPPDSGGRILVLSDGKWTGKDPSGAAARAAGRGIAMDYRLLARPQINEVAVQSFVAPQTVLPGQSFMINAWIQSPVDQEIQYQLRRGSTVISAGTRQISSGLSRLLFRDRAAEAGVQEYMLAINAGASDPIPENNQARALVGVEGPRPILLVSSASENSALAKLLQRSGTQIVTAPAARLQWSLEELSQFSAVILENVPASQLTLSGMETLASWVEETASGLMMTGGQKSYGPGGYFKSPLDRILPISMEMRREHRKFSLAIVVALDRSGSMAAPAGPGQTKMDLANIGTVQVLDLLSPTDEIGVIAVDSSPHVIVDIDTVERNLGQRQKILSIDSMGGGIFVFEALSAASRMLLQARAETRHIILFSDAADSEEPGAYRDLLEKCREAGITVSVVGLGTEADVDADLLKDIALRGGGTCYFTDRPEEIPRLFAQDTFTVARSTFIDEATPFEFTAGISLLGHTAPGNPPPVGGYNLCYIRPEANLAAVTTDEFGAPIVAGWNAGNGRVLCFTGEADGKFSGPFAAWDQVGEFYSTLVQWTAGQRQPLPDGMLLTQEVRNGVCFVQLHLDPERTAEPFATLPRVNVLHGVPGQAPAKLTAALQWENADLLAAAIPISGRETLLNTVEIPGQQPVSLSPVCLPYSPEFAPDQQNRGPTTLSRLAATTGGKERLELPQIWKELPTRSRFVEITPWLVVLGLLLFLCEILERRTGFFSRLSFRPAPVPQTASAEPEFETEPAPAQKTAAAPAWAKWKRLPSLLRRDASKKPPGQPATPQASKPSPAPASPPVSAPSAASSESSLEAMRKARERAGRRTGGGH